MVDEGEKHEAEDKARREQVETRNRADQLCHQVDKALEETGDKLPQDKVEAAKKAVADLRAAIDKQDDAAITSGTANLEKVMSEIAQTAYQGAAAGGGGAPTDGGNGSPQAEPSGDAPGGKKEGDVIDAEYEEGNPNP
jgi:molecular chaperone DnaK